MEFYDNYDIQFILDNHFEIAGTDEILIWNL